VVCSLEIARPGDIYCATGKDVSKGVTLRQRLDKWLWFARVAKTRSLAARLVAEGHVRLNARLIETPAQPVGPGDVLTIALERRVRVLKVVAPGARRGGFSEASLLFEELSDPVPRPALRMVLFKT
jgi:ribosome-associated heat shock protein Hsp15